MGADTKDANAKTEKVACHNLLNRIKELIKDGNAEAVRVKTDDGKVFLEIPLTPAALTGGVVVLAAPWVAVLAAIAALVAHVRVEIVPRDTPKSGAQT